MRRKTLKPLLLSAAALVLVALGGCHRHGSFSFGYNSGYHHGGHHGYRGGHGHHGHHRGHGHGHGYRYCR